MTRMVPLLVNRSTDNPAADEAPPAALADRVSALAAGCADPGELLAAIATETLRISGAEAVAFFRAAGAGQGATPRAQRLEDICVAVAPGITHRAPVERRLRAAGLIALTVGELWVRPARPRDRQATVPVPALVALPLLRGPGQRTVLVMQVSTTACNAVVALLRHAEAALGVAVRLAGLAGELDRADRRNAQLQAIFSNSSEAILTADRDFHIVEANSAFLTLLERDADTALGRHCSAVLQCRDEREQLLCGTSGCPLEQAFLLAHSAPYREVLWQTASGKGKEVSASFASVPSPDGPRGVIIARDMTPVHAVNRMRTNFVSMVSHELRTPLNSINGFLEIVLEGHVGALTRRQEEFLNYARTSTHQLMTLVEDILFISRADTGQFKLRFDSVALPEMAAQLIQSFQAAAQRAQVELRLALPQDLPTVYADELRLQQVLGNLVNNAIKFTPPQGSVTVSASVAGDEMRIDVSDTGEGVPLDEQVRIFERFYQSESVSQAKAGGYGLGLAIAKLIVEQHGGRIWVRSRAGVGSTFSFTLPLRPA
jgi:signal transduction histidine kinase